VFSSLDYRLLNARIPNAQRRRVAWASGAIKCRGIPATLVNVVNTVNVVNAWSNPGCVRLLSTVLSKSVSDTDSRLAVVSGQASAIGACQIYLRGLRATVAATVARSEGQPCT
jgi:hypothetical protein